MSPSILSASVSYAFSEGNMDDVEDGGPLMILQKIQAAMVASVVSEKGVADKNKDWRKSDNEALRGPHQAHHNCMLSWKVLIVWEHATLSMGHPNVKAVPTPNFSIIWLIYPPSIYHNHDISDLYAVI